MTKTNLFIVSQCDIKVKQIISTSLHVLKHISQTVWENSIIIDNKQYHFVFMNINNQNVSQLTGTSHLWIFGQKYSLHVATCSSIQPSIYLKNPFQFNKKMIQFIKLEKAWYINDLLHTNTIQICKTLQSQYNFVGL